MNELNFEFFEEFKRLDNLCRDIYGTVDNKLGVTLYLEDMERKGNRGRYNVSSWTSDYSRLKKIRNLRNELAHSQYSFSYAGCTQEDIDFVRDFYARILNQTDPIALFYKPISSSPDSTRTESPRCDDMDLRHLDQEDISDYFDYYPKRKMPFGCFGALAIFLMFCVCVAQFLLR